MVLIAALAASAAGAVLFAGAQASGESAPFDRPLAAAPAAQPGTASGTSGRSSAAAPAPQPGLASAEDLPEVPDAAESADHATSVEYLWVLRTSIVTREGCARTVERAKAMGVRGLLVQVVGRGDAYYRSDLLPRAEAIREPGLDPLGTLIPLAHEAGLEVHAWVNCLLVWSGPQPPRDPRHVLNAHPEWAVRLKGGARLAALSQRQRRILGVEGVFLAPANPGVRTWVARVAKEIAARYAVDGIHLDYIRQPGVAVGYDPTTRARFALRSGVDPERLSAVPAARRAEVASAWESFQREQVTAVVEEVRDSLARAAPGASLSAAVIADTVTAERVNVQSWRTWLERGLVDRVFVMCYAPVVQTVLEQMAAYARRLGPSDRLVPGIAVFNCRPSHAAAKILAARALGYPAVALYSYDALQQEPGYWPALRERLKSRPAGTASRRTD